MTLAQDYTLVEVAEALRMSTRWVRQKIQEGAEHQRKGRKITFTAAQVDLLRERFSENAVSPTQPITTGRKKRLS